jgi:hypothetical protein
MNIEDFFTKEDLEFFKINKVSDKTIENIIDNIKNEKYLYVLPDEYNDSGYDYN